jgi:hypothetical protein
MKCPTDLGRLGAAFVFNFYAHRVIRTDPCTSTCTTLGDVAQPPNLKSLAYSGTLRVSTCSAAEQYRSGQLILHTTYSGPRYKHSLREPLEGRP